MRLPFLYDFAAYTRFLIAIPLLILAEGLIERRVSEVLAHFIHSGLVPESSFPLYEAALHRGRRLRDSTLAELALLGFTAASVVVVYDEFPFDFSTWRSLVSDSVHARTLAGWWHLVVGVGLFQFLVWRWLWRFFIWYAFLWRVSRLNLRLIPTHPDGAAGLGFVEKPNASSGASSSPFRPRRLASSPTRSSMRESPSDTMRFPLRDTCWWCCFFFWVLCSCSCRE